MLLAPTGAEEPGAAESLKRAGLIAASTVTSAARCVIAESTEPPTKVKRRFFTGGAGGSVRRWRQRVRREGVRLSSGI